MRNRAASVILGVLMVASMGTEARAQLLSVFALHPNPTTLKCLQKATLTPFATVIVGQGALTDDLTIEGGNIKPGLQFDLFTVQTSSLLASGGADPAFKNF